MDFACLEMSILELWANDGKYDEATDKAMESLTNQDVLDKLNSFNKYEIIHLLLKYVIFSLSNKLGQLTFVKYFFQLLENA